MSNMLAPGSMTEAEALLAQIDDACRRLKIAQTTFGRLAVNDGKFVSRLQQGGRVTIQTVNRIHEFIAEQGGPSAVRLRSAITGAWTESSPTAGFRFYDNRQKYLMFVNTTSEKQMIADRALQEMALTQPMPPAIRIFDGGAGDGTALARLLRGAHRGYSWLPFYVVAKEISLENVRLTLEKMPDRFQEHPATMLVMTNLNYAEAPWLTPALPAGANTLVWHELSLEGTTAGDFEQQIAGLRPFLEQYWQVVSGDSGHPLPKTPAVLVIHRRDNRFALDAVLPRRGSVRADFDFVLLSQPYRARAPLSFKARSIVTPLVRALRRSGRLMGVHSHGNDPGMEIIQSIWPDETPFTTGRTALMDEVRAELGLAARGFRFHALDDAEALFRFHIHTLSTELDPEAEIGTSTVLAAWNAASYVAQIDDRRLAEVMNNDDYLEVTRAALRRHGGLWFNNETYVISRPAELG